MTRQVVEQKWRRNRKEDRRKREKTDGKTGQSTLRLLENPKRGEELENTKCRTLPGSINRTSGGE